MQGFFLHFENGSRVPLHWEFLIGHCLKLGILNPLRYQIGKFDILLNSILLPMSEENRFFFFFFLTFFFHFSSVTTNLII